VNLNKKIVTITVFLIIFLVSVFVFATILLNKKLNEIKIQDEASYFDSLIDSYPYAGKYLYTSPNDLDIDDVILSYSSSMVIESIKEKLDEKYLEEITNKEVIYLSKSEVFGDFKAIFGVDLKNSEIKNAKIIYDSDYEVYVILSPLCETKEHISYLLTEKKELENDVINLYFDTFTTKYSCNEKLADNASYNKIRKSITSGGKMLEKEGIVPTSKIIITVKKLGKGYHFIKSEKN